jgi:histidyl-tRNA synthetase
LCSVIRIKITWGHSRTSSNATTSGEATDLLIECLNLFDLDFRFVPSVKRGLTYYVEDGFEVECDALGAQKQVAGGGRYAEGIGWAIGLDRLLLAKK